MFISLCSHNHRPIFFLFGFKLQAAILYVEQLRQHFTKLDGMVSVDVDADSFLPVASWMFVLISTCFSLLWAYLLHTLCVITMQLKRNLIVNEMGQFNSKKE